MACILLGTHESVTYIDFVSDVCAAAELLLLEVSQANETLPDGAIVYDPTYIRPSSIPALQAAQSRLSKKLSSAED